VCGEPLPADQDRFCSTCQGALTRDPYECCPRCASTIGPFALATIQDGCTRCRDHSFRFERVLRLGPYDGLLREVILRIKHVSGEGLAELLGELWAAHAEAELRSVGAQAVIPVPLHWWRRWSRGYNQSLALARGLAAKLKLPCRAGWLRRIRHTPLQTQQTATDRRINVRGAFRASSGIPKGATLLLIDDVMTTGSTAHEAAAALLKAGAGRIIVAVLARAE
jgi:ComF family protein